MSPFHPTFNRRHFLSRCGTGFGALALEAMLRREAAASVEEVPSLPVVDPVHPFLPRRPHFAPRAKSVIFLYMVGGPGQMDTFDYKPLLQKLDGQPVPDAIHAAAARTRYSTIFKECKNLMASPFSFQQYGQRGQWVSELFPNVAKHVDDLCFIHTMQAESNNHAPASYQMHTGETVAGKASLGSWITYGLGTENQNLPGYVLLFENGPFGGAGNYSQGFLPSAFQATRLRSGGTPLADLRAPAAWTPGQRDSLDLINRMNLQHRAGRPGVTELDARIASYELAYHLQSSALEAGDLDTETSALRSSYGLDHADADVGKFGRKCLLARRLVERGVRFVQLYNMIDGNGWDAHTDLRGNHVTMARQCDQPIAALLGDLKQRGLLEETLVIWASEFGRTPMVQNVTGRQHNSAGFTVWMAGGGVRPGNIGEMDEIGLLPSGKSYGFPDLHATILAALGLDHERLTFTHAGRDEMLTRTAGTGNIIPGVFHS